MDRDLIKRLRWPEDKEKALALEERLRKRIRVEPLKTPPATVAGVDAAFLGGHIIGAACLYEFPSLLPLKEVHAVLPVRFPYIPGFLSFREGPAVIEAVEKLGVRPGLIIFDGQGIAHPRGLGIASFVGVLLDIPSVGSAKSRLVGSYREPGLKKGSSSALEFEGRVVGAVVRTRDSTKPLFVSPGHRIDIEGSVEAVLECVTRYRVTEPVRGADGLTKRIKKEIAAGCGRATV